MEIRQQDTFFTMSTNNYIISWGRDIKRSSSLAHQLRFKNIWFKNIFSKKYLKWINYIVNFFKTLYFCILEKPKTVILVAPPTIVIYSGLILKCIFKIHVIYDFHNGVLRKEWSRLPFIKTIIRNSTVISHNVVVKSKIDFHFKVNSVVIGDPFPPIELIESKIKKAELTREEFNKKFTKNIFVPLSYANDEPMEFLNELICSNPNINFIMSGDAPIEVKSKLNANNAKFTGFISNEQYDSTMINSDAVLCLSTDEDVQMCAIVEAVSLDKKVLCFNHKVNQINFSKCKNVFYIDQSVKDITEVLFLENEKQDFKNFYQEYNREKLNILNKLIGE